MPGLRDLLTRPSQVLFLWVFPSQAGMLVLSPILPDIARELGISSATAGRLRRISGATGGLTAVLLAVTPRRPGLRDLLSAGPAFVALGSVLSAAAATFEVLRRRAGRTRNRHRPARRHQHRRRGRMAGSCTASTGPRLGHRWLAGRFDRGDAHRRRGGRDRLARCLACRADGRRARDARANAPASDGPRSQRTGEAVSAERPPNPTDVASSIRPNGDLELSPIPEPKR